VAGALPRGRAPGRDPPVPFTLTGLTACLVSPISWTHHLFWIVPAEVVLVDLAAGTPTARWRHRPRAIAAVASVAAVAVFVVFSFSVVWYFSTHAGFVRGHDAATLLGADAYVLVMLALLVLLPARRTLPLPAVDDRARSADPRPGVVADVMAGAPHGDGVTRRTIPPRPA
jgi:alpha-1,2-mannosyltransferase